MVSTKDAYQKALLRLRDEKRFLNTQFLALLRAQYAAPAHTITATELARAVRYENYNAANLHYGTLAAKWLKSWGTSRPSEAMVSRCGSGLYRPVTRWSPTPMAIMGS